jgi:hypothetical protein
MKQKWTEAKTLKMGGSAFDQHFVHSDNKQCYISKKISLDTNWLCMTGWFGGCKVAAQQAFSCNGKLGDKIY